MDTSVMKHTQSCTQEEIFSTTFYCGEYTAQTGPVAFVGHCSDVLLLRRWMDGWMSDKGKGSALISPSLYSLVDAIIPPPDSLMSTHFFALSLHVFLFVLFFSFSFSALFYVMLNCFAFWCQTSDFVLICVNLTRYYNYIYVIICAQCLLIGIIYLEFLLVIYELYRKRYLTFVILCLHM